jgi:SAM-dependent methyltransferase
MPSRDFSTRAELSEWMDGPCTEQELRECLSDLEQVNRLVFAYRPTLQWLKTIAKSDHGSLHIVDVGCGGGDMLRAVERWASLRSLSVQLTGIDMNQHTLRFARERTDSSSCIRYVHGHAAGHPDVQKVDLVISSHMTHHLLDEEVLSFLQWMENTARVGWFINDLHREPFGFYAFRLLAQGMRWHRFIRHDGPVSVLRSFRKNDWARYLDAAGIEGATIRTFAPGRLCVGRTKLHA